MVELKVKDDITWQHRKELLQSLEPQGLKAVLNQGELPANFLEKAVLYCVEGGSLEVLANSSWEKLQIVAQNVFAKFVLAPETDKKK